MLLSVSCKDVFEEDLSDKRIVLTTPSDGWTGAQNRIVFRWEELEGVTGYELQAATPDLTDYLEAAVDTLVTTTEHAVVLLPDTYAWRVRGVNGSSRTPWSERRFIIAANGDLSDQVVPLLSPPDGAQLHTVDVLFAWQLLPEANEHVFTLRLGGTGGAVHFTDTVTTASLSVQSISEGTYAWMVQGRNASSMSQVAARSLTIDVTSPTPAILLSPAPNAELADSTIVFSWTPSHDALTGSIDSLIVVRNGLIPPYRSVATSTGYFADSLGAGTYTWKVTAHDGAGNTSSTSTRSFAVP